MVALHAVLPAVEHLVQGGRLHLLAGGRGSASWPEPRTSHTGTRNRLLPHTQRAAQMRTWPTVRTTRATWGPEQRNSCRPGPPLPWRAPPGSTGCAGLPHRPSPLQRRRHALPQTLAVPAHACYKLTSSNTASTSQPTLPRLRDPEVAGAEETWAPVVSPAAGSPVLAAPGKHTPAIKA